MKKEVVFISINDRTSHSQEGVCRTTTGRVQTRRDAEERTEIQTERKQTNRKEGGEVNQKLLVNVKG